MNFIESMQQYIPPYYRNMHLDGFEPWEIQVAMRKKRRLLSEETRRKREELENEIENIKIISEIKIK